MALDMAKLARGVLAWDVREQALDDVRFERVRNGFAEHYVILTQGQTGFNFERGEGYLKAGRFDAFALVDAGRVERIREARDLDPDLPGNVVAFTPRYGWLHYELVVRTTLIVWAALILCGWIALGGNGLLWIGALLLVWTMIIVMVQLSMKRKLRQWLARESWH